jgi:hypothetical protein
MGAILFMLPQKGEKFNFRFIKKQLKINKGG